MTDTSTRSATARTERANVERIFNDSIVRYALAKLELQASSPEVPNWARRIITWAAEARALLPELLEERDAVRADRAAELAHVVDELWRIQKLAYKVDRRDAMQDLMEWASNRATVHATDAARKS